MNQDKMHLVKKYLKMKLLELYGIKKMKNIILVLLT